MRDTTVLFYTNNVLAKPLLDYTFNNCLSQCRLNDCELIVISHYPLTEKYESHCLDPNPKFVQDVNPKDGTPVQSSFYDLVLKEQYPLQGVDCKSFVVGKMKYGVLSIMKQIRFGLDHASNDNIVLMEHDCLYPYNYIEACRKGLAAKEIAYVLDNRVMLNIDGFFSGRNAIYMGQMSFRKKTLMDDFDFKIENWEKKSLTLEPMVLTAKCKPDDKAYEGYCIDSDLGQDNVVIDIKHRLNACGYMIARDCLDAHPYWGRADKYISLFGNLQLPSNRNIFGYGIAGY